jgi:hypothetical protein
MLRNPPPTGFRIDQRALLGLELQPVKFRAEHHLDRRASLKVAPAWVGDESGAGCASGRARLHVIDGLIVQHHI